MSVVIHCKSRRGLRAGVGPNQIDISSSHVTHADHDILPNTASVSLRETDHFLFSCMVLLLFCCVWLEVVEIKSDATRRADTRTGIAWVLLCVHKRMTKRTILKCESYKRPQIEHYVSFRTQGRQ